MKSKKTYWKDDSLNPPFRLGVEMEDWKFMILGWGILFIAYILLWIVFDVLEVWTP